MFQDAIAFNQTVTFSDVTQVVQCNSMFLNSLAFNNGDITDGGNHSWTWTTPALVAATSMFDGASSFNQTVSFSNLGASAASMFDYATRFNNGDTANGGNGCNGRDRTHGCNGGNRDNRDSTAR